MRRALDLPLTAAEAGAGLVPPAAATYLLGKGGSILIVLVRSHSALPVAGLTDSNGSSLGLRHVTAKPACGALSSQQRLQDVAVNGHAVQCTTLSTVTGHRNHLGGLHNPLSG